MNSSTIVNRDNVTNSLQVSKIINVSGSSIKPGFPFLIKNNSETGIQLNVVPWGQSTSVNTVFFPGWNPELIGEIKGGATSAIQIGY